MVTLLSCYLFISPDRLLATNAVPLVITNPRVRGAPEHGLGQATGTQNQGDADEELHV